MEHRLHPVGMLDVFHFLFEVSLDSNNKMQQSGGLLRQPVQKLVATIL